MLRFAGVIVAMVGLSSVLGFGQEPTPTPAMQFEALKKEYANALDTFNKPDDR